MGSSGAAAESGTALADQSLYCNVKTNSHIRCFGDRTKRGHKIIRIYTRESAFLARQKVIAFQSPTGLNAQAQHQSRRMN
jgi:hypothetical protein